MKKQLLVGAMLMGAFFTANAQFATSFETSEGYEAGSIYGQDDWTVTSYEDELGGTVYVENQVITDDDASEGTMSLQINQLEEFPGQANLVVGAFRNIDSEFAITEISYSTWMSQVDGANFGFTAFAGENSDVYAGRLMFDYQEGVFFLEPGIDEETGEDALLYIPIEGFTWEAETWYDVKMVFNTQTETVTYFIDGEEVATSEMITTEPITMISLAQDNYGGFAYMDELSIVEGTLGTNEVLSSKFSVFPNPANDVINIANAENVLVNGVTIADINGRTVKSAQFAGVTNATVNVSDLASGVYMMTVSSDKGTATKKIVKN